MARKYRLVGSVRLDAADTRVWTRLGGGAFVEYSITGGLYYAAGDSQPFDIILELNNAFAANPDFGAGIVTFDITTGLWVLPNFTGQTITIQCVSPDGFPDAGTVSPGGRALFDYLRINTGDVAIFATGQAYGPENGLVHEGGFYPSLYMTEDRPIFVSRSRQSVPDRGPVQTLTFGYLRKQVIGVRLKEGYPRRSGESEWRQLNDFMERHLNRGLVFRFYPDRDAVAAALPFSERVNPLGYHTLVIDSDRTTWEPEFPFSPNLAIADARLECWTYVPR